MTNTDNGMNEPDNSGSQRAADSAESARPARTDGGAPGAGPPATSTTADASGVDAPATEKKNRRRISSWRLLLLLASFGGLAGLAGVAWVYHEFSADLPNRLDALENYAPARASRVYSRDGELIGEFFLQKRIVVPFSRIPKHVAHAFVAAEDSRFYDHLGIDPVGILRAMIANWRAGQVVQGASTITQQVARMLLLSNERTFERKIREVILAQRINREVSKEKTLHIYLNHVYLGHGAYGVQAAAEIYFGKDVEHLTVAEAALLAGLPKAPSRDSPLVDFPRSKQRQAYVITRMRDDGYITAQQADDARGEPIAMISRDEPLNRVAAPYFVEVVRRYVLDRYGGQEFLDRGVRIYATLDMKQQRAAEAAIRDGLEALDRRLPFRGPIGHLDAQALKTFLAQPPQLYGSDAHVSPAPGAALPPASYVAAVIAVAPRVQVRVGPLKLPLEEDDGRRLARWAAVKARHLEIGDLLAVRFRSDTKSGDVATLAQEPDVQAGLVAMDPKTGDVTAMVGGYSYGKSQFNRAVQAKRQAGSSIKAYVYTAAIEKGYTEVSVLVDGPVSIPTAAGLWTPKNYKREYHGSVTLRTALAKSINTISVKLVAAFGVDYFIDVMRRMGIGSAIPRHISVSLGTPDVTLVENVSGYATLASGGHRTPPRYILKILDADERVLERNDPIPPEKRPQVVAPEVAYVVVDMLKNVVENGTGKKAKELGRPAAGKTGTSNGCRDAWFVAFTADLLAGVWVGRDNYTPIAADATGGQVAAPIWTQFMLGGHPKTPVRDFPPPPGVYFARGYPDRGVPASPGTPGSILIPFRRGTIPPAFANRVLSERFDGRDF
jgi:penicillin-binding protein 1A